MKRMIGSLGMFAGMLVLAVSAMAQQEVSPDHFDAGTASAVQQRKAARSTHKTQVARTSQTSAKTKVSSQKRELPNTATVASAVMPSVR